MKTMLPGAALAAVLLLPAYALAPGCGDDEGCEGACECVGADCVCPSTGDCAVNCIDACDLQCAGSGNCDFECGGGCLASCTGSGECEVDVGGSSTVECTGSGDCDVACHGDCTVRCPGSGDCIVRCDPDADCNMESCSGSVTDCGDGVSICGTAACPG